ncbi:MAG: ABC transporter permease [Firmicutes bacterium]|nr:ABC transporter permease [Bacillota bacterium]
MKECYYLFKRNLLLYIRDRTAVFFSVLSMIIVLALMVVFLGDMNSGNVVDMLTQLGGERDTAADEENAAYLIRMWTLAGILEVNAVTITLTVMGTMIRDEAENRLTSFYTAPISRLKTALGYISASWAAGTAMCVLTLIFGEIYSAFCGDPLLGTPECLKLFGMIVLNTLVYAAVSYLLALFVHSESAWNSLLTIIGTLVGFAGAVYLPMSTLPEKVGAALKCLPVLHGASMMRRVCTDEAVSETFAGLPDAAGDSFREQMGVSVIVGGGKVAMQYQIIFLMIFAAAAIGISVWISKKRRLHDR